LTSAQFRDALTTLELSQGEAATWLGISIRSINGYAAGTHTIPEPLSMLLQITVRLGLKRVNSYLGRSN
jgi:hypothetical protein